MEKIAATYSYNGPVFKFDQIITRNWLGYTMAVSEKKARSNLEFQYKFEHGLARNAMIRLDPKQIKKEE